MNTIVMMNLEKFENEVTRMFDVLKNIMTSNIEEDYSDYHYPFFNALTYEDGIFLVYLGEYLKKICHNTEPDRTEEYRLEYEFRYIHIISGLFKKTFPNLNYEVYNVIYSLNDDYDEESDLWSLKYTPSNHTDDEETHVSKVTIHYDMETDLSLLEDTPDITFQIDGYNTALIIKSLSSIFGRPLYPKSTYDKVILNMMGYLVSLMIINLL